MEMWRETEVSNNKFFREQNKTVAAVTDATAVAAAVAHNLHQRHKQSVRVDAVKYGK